MTLFEDTTPWEAPNRQQNHEDGAPRQVEATQGVAQVVVTALLVALSFAAGWFGYGVVNRTAVAQDPNERLILQAWSYIDQQYVITGAIDHKKMAYAAIDAMVKTLNDTAHSRFETPEQIANDQNQLHNQPTVGIGVLLRGGGDKPWRIEAVIPSSPASKSNVLAGDLLVAVNGVAVQGKSFSDLHDLITGSANTTVMLTLIRPSVSPTATFDVAVTRAAYTSPTVESFVVPGTQIADILLLDFSDNAHDELHKALKAAIDQHVTGIILDLRNNGGGFLSQAVSVASEFIPAGKGKNVMITRDRNGQKPYAVESGGLATTIPMVVLVNEGTASASEIVTGAIKVNRPEVHVIGEKTAGTGTILETIYLADGSALVLGTSEWLLPNGQSIYHQGFQPDQPVTLSDSVVLLTPIVAQEQNFTLQQIKAAGDTQFVQALQDLAPQG